MDLGPITGIRSVSLFNTRKPQKDDSPRFEIDASAQAGDESFTSSQDSPEHKEEEKLPEQTAADDRHDDPAAAPDQRHNWFV